MIVTTLSNYPGYKIVEHLGLVFAYDDIPRFTRFAMDMDKCIENAEKCLAKKAKEKGANAVLGVSMSLSADNKPMLLGTAVILEEE